MKIINKNVLVLNQDYSPISVCNAQKAFVLLFLNKADMLAEEKSLRLRTVEQSFPFPSVIRLNHYVNIPYKSVLLTRQNVFRRDAHTCQYCGKSKDLTLDHVIPKSKGGKSIWKNLVTACKRCNMKKGDKTPEQNGMKLIRKPFKPSYVMFIRDFSGSVNENWKPFLQSKDMMKV